MIDKNIVIVSYSKEEFNYVLNLFKSREFSRSTIDSYLRYVNDDGHYNDYVYPIALIVRFKLMSATWQYKDWQYKDIWDHVNYLLDGGKVDSVIDCKDFKEMGGDNYIEGINLGLL